jgi:hypothetical protein
MDACLLRGRRLTGRVHTPSYSNPVATLVTAIAQNHPAKAAKLRDFDDLPSQRAILGSLAHIVYPRRAQREIELWRVTDSRELRCIALYLPTGIDLRLMEGEEFRRTRLLRDGPAVQQLAEEWKVKLREAGFA